MSRRRPTEPDDYHTERATPVVQRLAARCERRYGPVVPLRRHSRGNYRPILGINGVEESTTYREIYWIGFAIAYANVLSQAQAQALR